MAKSYDYQSAFDIIGRVMMGPSSSHTAGAINIGNLYAHMSVYIPENIEIHYYDYFAAQYMKDMVQMSLLWVEQWNINI